MYIASNHLPGRRRCRNHTLVDVIGFECLVVVIVIIDDGSRVQFDRCRLYFVFGRQDVVKYRTERGVVSLERKVQKARSW